MALLPVALTRRTRACRIPPLPPLSTIQAQDAGACLAAFYRQALRKATVELPVEFRQGGN